MGKSKLLSHPTLICSLSDPCVESFTTGILVLQYHFLCLVLGSLVLTLQSPHPLCLGDRDRGTLGTMGRVGTQRVYPVKDLGTTGL